MQGRQHPFGEANVGVAVRPSMARRVVETNA